MKPLQPTLKEKRRYMVFEVISGHNPDMQSVKKTIRDSAYSWMGENNMASAGMQFIDKHWNPGKARGMIRVNRKYVDELKSAFGLIKNINGHPAIISSVGVSGIIKKAVENYLK